MSSSFNTDFHGLDLALPTLEKPRKRRGEGWGKTGLAACKILAMPCKRHLLRQPSVLATII